MSIFPRINAGLTHGDTAPEPNPRRVAVREWLDIVAMRGADPALNGRTFSPLRWPILCWLTDCGQPVSDRVRAMLRAHLFALVPMWLVGIANSVMMNAIAAIRHPDALHVGFFLADLTLGLCRITLLILCYRRSARNLPTPTDLFMLGDHLSLWFVGAAALIAFQTDDESLLVLIVASTVAISGGLVVRSYVAPRGAVLQLFGCITPIAVGGILSENTILLVFSAQIPFYLFVVGNAAFRINAMLVATMLAEEESLERSLRDSLTGLANRPAVERTLGTLCADPAAPDFAVLYIDLDGFKAVNDTHGHGAGDQLLIAVAGRLRGAARPTDVVARLGGDEFVVLARDLDREGSVRLARRIVQALGRDVLLADLPPIRIGGSVGIACAGSEPRDAVALLGQADGALYRAKALGKNRCIRHGDPVVEHEHCSAA
ncbi:diguanylate cyclase [Methylobacterium planeticum]|nr:GGDEF domain-containing protein [Methylobacterium planeticum]